jgi:hypothetical protein
MAGALWPAERLGEAVTMARPPPQN